MKTKQDGCFKIKHMPCVCYILLLIMFSVLLSGQQVSADEVIPYEIGGYNVQVRVTKQNVCYVTEEYWVIYHQAGHNFYRDIPTVRRIRQEDGSYSEVKAKVFNVECDAQHDVKNAGDYISVEIGDRNAVSSVSDERYTLSYEYHMGNDVLENVDEFCYNIVDTNWNVPVSSIRFTVEMPENIDKANMEISYSSGKTEGVDYRLEGNVLSGKLDPEMTLSPGEGVTVRMTLPEGYFDIVRTAVWPAVVAILLSVVAMGVSFVMWWKLGKDDEVVEVIQFHPPRGLNSLEVAYAVKGEADREDVLSLLVYLAQKGYITIHEKSEKGLLSGRSDFSFEKKREYDGNNGAEKMFMQGLFADGDVIEKKDLQNKFYKTVDKILGKMNSQRNKEILFNKDSLNKHMLFIGMAAGVFFFSLFKPMYDYNHSLSDAVFMPVLFAVFFYFGAVAAFYADGLLAKLMYGVPLFMILTGFFVQMCLPVLRHASPIYRGAFIICIIACLVIMFFDHYMPKRTVYGTEILGRLKGFRTFLNTAEKDRLKLLVEEEPEYFFKILPYTYVLDVSDTWMKKFESITMESPGWYDTQHGASGFNVVQFNSFMSNTMDETVSSVEQTKTNK